MGEEDLDTSSNRVFMSEKLWNLDSWLDKITYWQRNSIRIREVLELQEVLHFYDGRSSHPMEEFLYPSADALSSTQLV